MRQFGSAHRIAYQLGRKVYTWGRREVPNRPESNGEYQLQRTLLQRDASKCQVFVDVGANLGEWTLNAQAEARLKNVDLQSFCFEPVPSIRLDLANRISGTGYESKVRIQPQALGSVCGRAAITIEPGVGSNSLIPSREELGRPLLDIDVITLDMWAAEEGLTHIDLVKIDTEGNDLAVLLGATRLISERAIDVVQFEYNHRWLFSRTSLLQVFELAMSSVYVVGKLTGGAILIYTEWHPELDRYFEGNYALIRRDVLPDIAIKCVSFDTSNLPASH